MADARIETAGELALLRRALAEIEPRLERLEEWRALRQLNERERNGNPLEGIDGVLFRGRLVQKLAESSRDWRAYVRIEEAIGQLLGPVRLEPGILKNSARFEMAEPAAAAPTTPAPANPVALPESTPVTLSAAKEALDPQRLRFKVRAGSATVSPPEPTPALTPASTPVEVILGSASARPVDVAPVASLSPRAPLPAEPGMAAQPAPADPQSPRSVLQRIRLVSKVRAPEDGARGSDGGPAFLGVPTGPPVATVAPPTPPAAQPLVMLSTAVETGPGSAVVPPGAQPEADNAATKEHRLDALEAELELLIDRSAHWPHPLDAHRERAASPLQQTSAAARMPAMLEPDAPVDLDVDEAEVTIIRRDDAFEVVPESEPAAARVPAARRERLSSTPVSAEADDVEDEVNGNDYAGYHLALEEASVEIVVSGEPEAAADHAGDDDSGKGRGNHPPQRRRVLTGE